MYREYDIQPRPASAAVGSRVPPYPAGKGRESGRPRVGIVRGPNLNPWEMQNYEPLAGSYDLTAYTTTNPSFDISKVRLPVVKVPPHPQHGAYMQGLEFALFDEDLIFSADTTWMFSFQAAGIREKFGKKLVCLQWENIPFAYEEREEMKALKSAVRAGADHFIAVTERAREALVLEGVDPGRITVIPMGIDTEGFRPDAALRDSCRASLGISPGEIVVLFTGRMVWEKGVYDLVHAAKLVKAEPGGRPVRYVMVGKGPEREAVMARAGEIGLGKSFLFVESHPYDRMRDLYNAADLFVLPSISMTDVEGAVRDGARRGDGVRHPRRLHLFRLDPRGGRRRRDPRAGERSGGARGGDRVAVPLRRPEGGAGKEGQGAGRRTVRFEGGGGTGGRGVRQGPPGRRQGGAARPRSRPSRRSGSGRRAGSARSRRSRRSAGVRRRRGRAGEGGAADRSYYRQERREVEAMIPAGASRILDIGCGEGALGRALLEKGASEVVGIETDPATAEAARKNLTRVFRGDVETLDLPFDGRIFRLHRPGGRPGASPGPAVGIEES